MDGLKSRVKVGLGTICEMIFPGAAREIDAGTHSGSQLRMKEWILEARKARARMSGNESSLQRSLFGYWRADTANTFYDRYTERFQKWFLGPHHEIVDRLAELARAGNHDLLVEVGCGDGRVLEHCAEAMPEIREFLGIDINPMIIARNGETYADTPALSFLATDAAEWLTANARSGMILLTYGGVLEYFAADTLASAFSTLAAAGTTAVALVEPVDPAHDLVADLGSHSFGEESSFSHNHGALLRAAGFTINFEKEMTLGGVRWMMMLAVSAPADKEK